MWIVTLIKAGSKHDFRSDFFPRKVRYKKDAQILKDEVKRKGGEATISKWPFINHYARSSNE